MKDKKIKLEIELKEDEVLQRDVKQFGNASHIILPQRHKDKKATIIIKK